MSVRRGTAADARPIAELIAAIAAERIYTAIDKPFTPEEEAGYIAGLSERDGIFLAETEEGELAGIQTLEAWAPTLGSMNHVAQIGTFIAKRWRGQGIGRTLFAHTVSFARSRSYRKLLAQVRASNTPALAFYQRCGFQPVGRLTRQVIIDGVEDDEILLEHFLDTTC